VVGRRGSFAKLRVFLGDSLLTTEGPAHRLRRRQVQPAFTRDRLRDYAGSIVAAAEATGAAWQPGQPVAMEREMAALTMDAIGRAVLGVDGRALAPQVGAALERLMLAMPLLFVPHIERLVNVRVPGLGWMRRAMNLLDGIAQEGATTSESALVKALRTAADEVPQLNRQEVRDELLTLLLAGHETTAMSLTWAWWFLDTHPEVAERMRSELSEVVGDRSPEYGDVERLHYTQAVVAEALRLRPPAWINEREVVGDLQLGSYRPKPGTLILMPTWVFHRDDRWWSEPLGFRPERWLDAEGRYDEKAPGQPRGAYLPFGAGAHACIGSAFAWFEAVLALAVLVPRWRPRLEPGADVGIRASVTMRPAHGMPMRLTAVEPALQGREPLPAP
jgi:cytochrome P450